MPNTYTQIYIHIVFAVKSRMRLIPSEHKEALHQYITGIIKKQGNTPIAINSMPDHIHILLGMRPDILLSDIVRDIKSSSTRYIQLSRWSSNRFKWQEGFAAFSYARSQLPIVARYIARQEAHHAKSTFSEELRRMLDTFDCVYDSRYLPEPEDC